VIDEFYKRIADIHRSRRETIERENYMLWDLVIDFVKRIDETPHDGSGIAGIKKFNDEVIGQLMKNLEGQALAGRKAA